MKIIDVYSKMRDSLKEDNPLKTLCNKDTTEIFDAVYSPYSRRGQHYVEYKFISPEWNRTMFFDLSKICSTEIMFTRKSNALRFVKLVNVEGDYKCDGNYVDLTEKTIVDSQYQKQLNFIQNGN